MEDAGGAAKCCECYLTALISPEVRTFCGSTVQSDEKGSFIQTVGSTLNVKCLEKVHHARKDNPRKASWCELYNL